MEQIIENFSNSSALLNVKDPYIFSLELMDKLKDLGKIVEHKNHILVSGSRSKIDINFDVIKFIDDNTKVVMNVVIRGEQPIEKVSKEAGKIRIDISAKSKITYKKTKGIIEETFNDFYSKKLMPELKKISKTHAKHITTEAEKTIKVLEKKFK